MWRWMSVLVVMCMLSYGYGIYSVINATFPFKQVRALKKTAMGQEAGFLNPGAAAAADVFKVIYSDADVAMVGDSITAGGPWAEMFPTYSIVNRGIGGDTTLGVLNRIEDVMLATPRAVFVMVGINDIYGRTENSSILERYGLIADALEGRADLYIQSTVSCSGATCPPARRDQVVDLNMGLQKLAQTRGVTFVDLNAQLSDAQGLKPEYTHDGIHLNGAGFKVWADVLAPYLAAANG